ncbi:alanine racemase [Marinobacter orientalis]|uniref:Alanine racemase n=1 Tax=Marinobacter orientalis TaxID=1928859 RepID=A0A7Y0WSP3_9GAMM|nr:alanine racemase [Marinobacter orientalis]NMT64089.1 alanine racemase [Marinobacter orientalis]TGX49321.1 alanine racemase [Marinobacter orientalis]
MPRNTVARIDISALRHNYRLACALASPARAMAVIKADGYGHGIGEVARALADDAPRFAVACIEEAQAIREAGIGHPVVLLQGVHSADDLAICAREGFEMVVHSDHQLDWLEHAAETPTLWLKVNTGMNRLGFAPVMLVEVMDRLERYAVQQKVVGFVTHFACADDVASSFTDEQTRLFTEAVADWPSLQKSAGNSAAHFLPGQPLFDLSRPGIMLYGASPMLEKTGPQLGLKPVMTLEAQLTAVRTLKPGESVGYACSWTAERETRMGIVAIGYGDGYPRHAGTDTPAWVAGHRIRLIGRVSMDMLAVDLTGVPGACPGDTVELWGGHVSVDEVAQHAGTIAYELLTGITARVPRLYRSPADRAG